MIIKHVSIKKLHGYLSKEISFNSDINLLVGINGSGKTSLLNVISWLLNPSFPDLCTNEFEELSIEFTNNKDAFIIISKQTNEEVTIEITNQTKGIIYQKIQADLKISPRKLTQRSIDFENLLEDYRRLTPEKHEIEAWNLIFNEIPKPIIIGLDRNLYTEEGNEISYIEDNGIIRKRLSSISKKSPLDKVIRLSGIEYSKYKNKILDLNKRLNDKIMLSSFDETLTVENINELLNAPKISLKQVESLEVKVREYFEENFNDRKRAHPHKIKSNEDAFKKIEAYHLMAQLLFLPFLNSCICFQKFILLSIENAVLFFLSNCLIRMLISGSKFFHALPHVAQPQLVAAL